VRLSDLRLRHVLLLWLAGVFAIVHSVPDFGYDSHAYWLTAHHAQLYRIAPTLKDSFEYSPAFAQLIAPVAHFVPWLAFGMLWSLAETIAFSWLLAPLGWRLGVPLVMCCGDEIARGNIYAFLAVAIVLGATRGWPWAIPMLTKITPGLGPVWFALRRDWRHAFEALVHGGRRGSLRGDFAERLAAMDRFLARSPSCGRFAPGHPPRCRDASRRGCGGAEPTAPPCGSCTVRTAGHRRLFRSHDVGSPAATRTAAGATSPSTAETLYHRCGGSRSERARRSRGRHGPPPQPALINSRFWPSS
jgi:hypothetical protein